MSLDRISEQYRVLGVTQSEKPNYTGAQAFASQFKKCSILKESNTTYSGSSTKVNIQLNAK